VYGSTQRLNQEHQNSPKSEGADYVKVALTDGQGVAEEKAPTPAPAVADPNEYVNEERRNSTTPAFPPPPPNQTHPHHLRHTPGLIQGDNDAIRSAPNSNQIDQYPASDPYMGPEVHNGTVIGNRVLLNERLAGDFHRTFAFPCPISDDAVKAMMENGVLKVVVPKREVGEVRRGRKVPIIRGNFWTGGEKVGKGTAFGVSSGAV
jgi:HSP20 family protein